MYNKYQDLMASQNTNINPIEINNSNNINTLDEGNCTNIFQYMVNLFKVTINELSLLKENSSLNNNNNNNSNNLIDDHEPVDNMIVVIIIWFIVCIIGILILSLICTVYLSLGYNSLQVNDDDDNDDDDDDNNMNMKYTKKISANNLENNNRSNIDLEKQIPS